MALPLYPLAICYGPQTWVCYEYAQVPEQYKGYAAIVQASMNEAGVPQVTKTDAWELKTTLVEIDDLRMAGNSATIRCLAIHCDSWDVVPTKIQLKVSL